MTEATGTRGVTEIVLATDLSCRSDRAMERTRRLAKAWGAHITAVTAVEGEAHAPGWRSPPPPVVARVRAELGEALGPSGAWDFVVAAARPTDLVLDVAQERGAGLVVVGVARNELLGRANPGRLVEALMRRAAAPVLVVRRRASREYRRVLVPTDFSRAAELATVRAMELFPDAEIALLHAYRVPFAALMDEADNADEMAEVAQHHLDEFIARVERQAGRRGSFRTLLEYGCADDLVADFGRSDGSDVMVLGVHERRGLLGALTPDVASRLLLAWPGDVLVVHEAAEAVRRSMHAATAQA